MSHKAPASAGGKQEEAGGEATTKHTPFDPESIRVPFGEWERAVEVFEREGVVVLTGTYDAEAVRKCRADIGKQLEVLCGVDMSKPSTWTADRLPPQTRSGLFQGGIGNLPAVWDVRSHPNVCEAFRQMYAGTRSWVATPGDLGPMVSSLDGVNLKPPVAPFAEPQSRAQFEKYGDENMVDMKSDWAHVDQNGGKWWNVMQGQMVLSDTSAGFVCSPRSHKLCAEILALNGRRRGNGKSGFCRLRDQTVYANVAELVRGAGGHFQVAVRAPAGSLVLWSSTTLHSARIQLPPASASARRAAQHLPWTTPTSPAAIKAREECEDDWRFVIYVCHRPLRDVGDRWAQRKHVDRLQTCWRENRNTNHAGERVFGKVRSKFLMHGSATTPAMKRILETPELVYEMKGLRPEMTEQVAALLGIQSKRGDGEEAKNGTSTTAGAGAGVGTGGGAAAGAGGQTSDETKQARGRRAQKRAKRREKRQRVQHF